MMDRKVILSCCISVVLAAATSFMLHENSVENFKYRFRSGGAIRKDLELTIGKFNQLYASFYVTGGSTYGLSDFPAANLIKRRIYQDIDLWQKQNQWYIHDLHNFELTKVKTVSRDLAVVETKESWDTWLRNTGTGMKSGRKTNAIQSRYYVGRERGRWVVWDYEVYGMNEDMPPLNESIL